MRERERDDLRILERVRERFRPEADGCDRAAKVIVEAVNRVLADRRRRAR